MATTNSTDLLVRLQLAGCKYGDLALEYVNDLKFGRKCATKHQWELFLLNVYLEILECHEIDNENSCFTDEEIQSIFNKISELTDICFKPIGFSYKPR